MVPDRLIIKNDETFTIKQLKEMGHCVGWNPNKLSRNYFSLRNNSDSWDDLMERGYADKSNKFGNVNYNLTEKGIRLVRIFTGK